MGQALAASVPSDDERVQYGVSSHGFLPEACVSRLPSESVFEPLEALADELPRLNREGALRAAVDGLVCDISAEDVAALGVGELRRAYVVCAYLTHAYAHARGPRWELIGSNVALAADAHGASGSAPRIPSALARALVLVCARIGLPPVLTAAATDLWNWRLVDPAQPLALDNLTTITSLTGTPTEVGFHMLPCAMHALFAPLLGRVYRAPLLDDAARMLIVTGFAARRRAAHGATKFAVTSPSGERAARATATRTSGSTSSFSSFCVSSENASVSVRAKARSSSALA